MSVPTTPVLKERKTRRECCCGQMETSRKAKMVLGRAVAAAEVLKVLGRAVAAAEVSVFVRGRREMQSRHVVKTGNVVVAEEEEA